MSLNQTAQEYFGNINSMAKRILTDMEETKTQYEHLWHTLPEDEKNQILTDSIMKPQILLKYDMDNNRKINNASNNYATKIIVDDNCSYNDEHSGPFSFRTKSQRDLTLTCENDRKLYFKTPTISKDESSNQNKPKPSTNTVLDNLTTISNSENIFSSHSLPRTGLDLLDNW